MRSVDWVAYLLLESLFISAALYGDEDTAWKGQKYGAMMGHILHIYI